MEKSLRAKVLLALDGGKKSSLDLAQETGADRKVVREALVQLKSDKLVRETGEKVPGDLKSKIWDLNR